MSTKLQIQGILMVLVATSATLLITIVFYTQQEIKQATDTLTEERLIVENQIANRLELRFSDAIKILQLTSKNDHITNPPLASAIDNKLHGIPENVDTDRRKVMHDVYETYGGFQNLLFLLPNGDVYINEPFFFQNNMTTSNFAFRDWYKDVISSNSVIVSPVIISKSSIKPNVVIAVPVFSQSGSLEGILTGSLNLDATQEYLKSLQSYTNERILILDSAQTIAADSGEILKGQKFPAITTVTQNALVGENGTDTDTVNGTNMFVVYSPVKIGQTTWAVISMQPYDDAFHSVNLSIQESWILAILIISITSISSYYLYTIFRRQVKLSKELEKANIELQIKSQKLHDADTAKEEFATMVTHELKTPLVTINGYSEMLKEPGILGTLNSEQEDVINRIYASSKKLENLIGDILVAQKLDLNKIRYNKVDFDVGEFVNDIAQTYSSVIKDKQIQFKNITTERLTIKTDKDRLSQVFDNLIRNSIDFVPSTGGEIEIGAKSKNENIEFFVKDNGTGIPKEKQANLFRKFYQIDSSLRRQHGGTGLGLVICKGIVEGLGGKIWLESDVGKGTIFYFLIPKHDGADDAS